MTSEPVVPNAPEELYVWIWLPGKTEPVVAGRIVQSGSRVIFNYGQSYLARENRMAIFDPELPLRSGAIPPLAGLSMAGCLRDASPDAWGRRVILNRMFGSPGREMAPVHLSEMTYLLHSGSQRTGAVDFQASPDQYIARENRTASLTELMNAVELVEAGVVLPPDLNDALFHGTSLGGARPKASIQGREIPMLAKFSSASDSYNIVKAEYLAMRLADQLGLDVAKVQFQEAAGKQVLLIERFDRIKTEHGWSRKAMVSALTLFGLDEMMARYASYTDLAEIVRHRFTAPRLALKELYCRLVFNILCGNTDDHARNHAAFWDGSHLSLTPAYDICPQARAGNEASQAMLIVGDQRLSTLANCIEAAPHFQLGSDEALRLIQQLIDQLHAHWDEACKQAALNSVERALFSQRMFLNPFIFAGAPSGLKSSSLH